MADRVRSMVKKSTSTRGSMSHMGTTPYKYNVDVFISHVDNIKTADEVCLVWDRRGKVVHTAAAKVANKKATFRETLSMETTLFRRAGPGVKTGAEPKPGEELKFDEKKAKFALRRGTPSGKALGKIVLNLADYVKGVSGTLFADLKLSNGSVAAVKIDARFLHIGKKKRESKGDNAGSDGASEMSEMDNNMENDSIFGDSEVEDDNLEIPVCREAESVGGTRSRLPATTSPVSDPSSPPTVRKSSSVRLSKRMSSALLKESPSVRGRTKSRAKDKDASELRRTIEGLRAENEKLKRARKAAVEEIDALKEELASAEELTNASSPARREAAVRKAQEEMTFLRKRIKELKSHNDNLIEELEELHQNGTGNAKNQSEEVSILKEKVQHLEVQLRREPKFMDVVNELKVAKVSLALANMEKEQAIFALQQKTHGL